MVRLEKKCKECEKVEVSEVKYRPIFDSDNWICRDCQSKINEQINKGREEKERKREEEYRIRQENERKEKEKWKRLLNSESVNKLEDIMEKYCWQLPGACSTWKCSSGDKIVFAKSNEIKSLGRWGEEQPPTLYCAKCYLNHDFEGKEKKEKLLKKDIIDDDVNTNCGNCNKKLPGRDWHLWRGYYQDGINKTGILCYIIVKAKQLINLLLMKRRKNQWLLKTKIKNKLVVSWQLFKANRKITKIKMMN